MKDHETTLVKQIEEKNRKLYEENRRLEDEVFRKASLPDKIHAYLTMFAVMVIVFSVFYVAVSLIRLYILK